MKLKRQRIRGLVRKEEAALVPSSDKEFTHLVSSARLSLVGCSENRTDGLKPVDVMFEIERPAPTKLQAATTLTKERTVFMQQFKAYAASCAHGPLEPFGFDPSPLGPEEVEIKVSHRVICHSDFSQASTEQTKTTEG